MNVDRLTILLARYLGDKRPQPKPVSVGPRARDLIAAIDAGGVPLNPFIVNDIARRMGLTVATDAHMADTIEKIRKALGS